MFWSQHLGCWGQNTSRIQNKEVYATLYLQAVRDNMVALQSIGTSITHYIMSGEVIGFRLFRATGLAFAIRPKDGVARRGRRGGFHCYCSKACWNNFSVVVRVRGRAIVIKSSATSGFEMCFCYRIPATWVLPDPGNLGAGGKPRLESSINNLNPI